MAAALQTRTVEARGDTVMAELTAVEATRARDALCRALYNRLFTWIVNRANEAIKVRLELRGPSGSGGPALGGLTVRAQCDISLDRCCNCNAGGMSSDSLYGEGADFFFVCQAKLSLLFRITEHFFKFHLRCLTVNVATDPNTASSPSWT